MTRKKKQDNTSDNIQNIVNDASVLEKKTSQKRVRSKVEDDSSNKKPEIAELEDRLGLSIDYNEEENVITLTPNHPQQIISVTSDGTRLTPHQRKALFASTNKKANLDDAEFVVDGDEVLDYIFGEAAQQLTLINRCELYLIGRAFTPSIVENLWEPTDDDPSHTYGDMADCSIETFNSDPWNLFIYSKSGRRAVTFGELTTGTFYLQCAAAEYVPNSDDPSSPLKQPMRDVYGRQMYRKVYFNGQIGQFPRINIGSYQGEDPQTGEMTTTQYDKYQYVANENSFSVNHMVWPQRKVTFYFNNLNFLCNVEVVEGYNPDNTPILKNDNNSRNEQVVEFLLPARWAGYEPSLNMTFKITVRKNVGDIQNAYKYAVKASEDGYWGGTIGYTSSEDPDAVLAQYSIRATRSNTPPDTFEEIIVSSMYPQNTLTIALIDHDINVHIQPVRKNFTKKFIIMSDGNLIVTDITELNDYLHLYTQEQIQEMGTPDQIIVSYKNTIGFLSTSPEWPWNRTIRVSAAIASEYQGIRFKAIGRYNDSSHMYDEYVKYRQGIMSDFTWDEQAVTIDGITCTPSHNGEGEYTEEQPYIDYSISINKQALDESWERLIFYLAFEPIPKFVSTTLKIFIGYDPVHLQVKTASGTELNEQSDNFVVRNGDLWSFKYTTQQNDFGLDDRDPNQEGFLFEITNNGISTSQYSHVFISDNTTAIRDRIELPEMGMVKLAFTGRMYHNMSLFLRPLVAAKIKFFSNHNPEFGPNDQHFFIEYNNESNVPLESERQLTSEQDLIFSIKHDGDANPTYTHISVDIDYGSNHWGNLGGGNTGSTYIIPNRNTLTFTISGFAALMDPTIEYCYVTIKLSQIYSLSVNIKHPDNSTPYWPGSASAVLRNNSLIIGGLNVSAKNIETTTVDNITTTTYTFSTIYGDSGTGNIDINDRHCCGRAYKPDGTYEALTSNHYARQSANIAITVNAGAGGYTLDIQPFKEMHYEFMYQSTGGGGHITVVPYTFDEYYNGWPANMDDLDDMSEQTSWQPTSGNDGAQFVTPDMCMPLFGFCLLPSVDPVTHNLDIFSKMTLGLQVVDSGGNHVAGPWSIASDYDFENLDSYFGVCPGSLTDADARSYFYPQHNGENIIYQFVVQMSSQIAAEDLRITKVVYAKNTGGTGTVSESSGNPGINAISNAARLPGENPSNASGNLEVHVHVPHALDTDHTLSLEFLDSSGGQLNAMYPMDAVATQVSGNIYKFSVTTKTDELYCVESPNHTFYSGDNQYTMKVKYNDNQYHWLDVETCTYYMHPVFKLWFNDGTTNANSFSFDDSGNATIYFSVHIAGAPDASHPNGTTRTPNSGAYPGDPDMNLPTAGSTYNQTQWNASGCVLQIANAPGLTFACDGVIHVVSGGGNFYKLEVSGGVGFSGEVTFTLNVFNKSKTATLRNIVTFSNITWWNGSSMTSASNMDSAYLSPVTRFGTSGNLTNVLSMTALIDPTAAASLDLDSATLTCGLNCGGRITCSAIHPASGTNLLSLSVTVDFSMSEHPEYGAQKIDDWNLSKRNNEHPELSDYASMLYTGRPIPFTLSIDDFSYTFYVKLGPVLFIWVNNTTGGELKPHTGQEHVVRARAREWYSLDGGATVRDTGNYYGTGEDTSYTAREYYAKFEYYNGSTYSEIPNVTPSSSSIKSQRTGNGFNIVAPTTWIDYTQSPPHPYEDDWGAWRIAVTDESHANESGKMRATMQVFDHQTPEHSVLNWYPINATALEVNVRDFMTVSGIHFWIGRSDGAKYGAMKFEESVMPPIEPVGTSSAIDIYLAFADTSQLDIDSATITTPYSATISIEKDTTGGQITTQVGSQTYTNVHWDLLIKAKVTTNLDTYNLDNGYTYYTGLPIQFNLSISGTGSSTGYSTPFEIPLGPVIALHNGTPNSINPLHNDGAVLKPVVGNQCVSQTRGHEWYMDSDKAIHMTSNGNVNNDTEQGHTWNVTWSFNGTNLTAALSPDAGYNRQFAYPNNASPCIKIQHPASWTEIDDSVHSSDTGAWLISILNTTDPATELELNGTLIGTVTVTDENSSLPVYKRVHNWYPAKDTVYSIHTVSIQKVVLCSNISSSTGNPYLSDPQTIWQASDGGTIKLPASSIGTKLVIFANIPQYMNDEVNSTTWASKVHILPGNNNLYSYRLTGTNSRFYLDVWPWYTKKLNDTGRSTHNATHYVTVTVGSLYDSGSFGRTDADGYWISKNSNTANPYQIKIVTSDTEIQPDDPNGTVYAFNYTLDGVIDLKVGNNASDGYKVLGVHMNESTTIRVWHTLITNATKRETNPVPNYTVPDEQITSSNISFTDAGGSTITMPSTVDVQVSAYQQDSETHLYYVDVTLRNTADMPNYEELSTTLQMKVTIGRRSVTRVFYLAYANLEEALLREDNGAGDYEYNYFWNRESGEPLGLPCAYKSDMDIKLLFNGYPGGSAGDGYLITEIKFDYPGTTGDELGNLFDGLFTSSNDQWVGPALRTSRHIFTGLTTRNGYHLGSYEEYNIIIKTADGHKYIQKFSFPTMCIFNGIWIEPSCAWESGGVTYGLFMPEHGNEFTFQFRHQYKQWSTTQETFIHPLTSDRLTASNVKFYLCNSDETVISETNDIQVNSMGYQGTDTTYSPSFNVYCTIKLVSPPSSEAMYKVVITNNTCPSGTPYLYEDEYLSVSTDTGILRVSQLSFFCFGGGE